MEDNPADPYIDFKSFPVRFYTFLASPAYSNNFHGCKRQTVGYQNNVVSDVPKNLNGEATMSENSMAIKRQSYGEQIKLASSPTEILATLDNGVTVMISFNNGEINLHFSGINYDRGLGIREINQDVRLGNDITVLYSPRKEE